MYDTFIYSAYQPGQDRLNYIEWKNLETIVIVKATRETKNKKVTETRYYISSCACDAEFLMHAIRKHWGIESMHWILDVTFREDASRIRKGDHIALNTLKKYASVKDSMPGKIQRAALSDSFREDVLNKVLKISIN